MFHHVMVKISHLHALRAYYCIKYSHRCTTGKLPLQRLVYSSFSMMIFRFHIDIVSAQTLPHFFSISRYLLFRPLLLSKMIFSFSASLQGFASLPTNYNTVYYWREFRYFRCIGFWRLRTVRVITNICHATVPLATFKAIPFSAKFSHFTSR